MIKLILNFCLLSICISHSLSLVHKWLCVSQTKWNFIVLMCALILRSLMMYQDSLELCVEGWVRRHARLQRGDAFMCWWRSRVLSGSCCNAESVLEVAVAWLMPSDISVYGISLFQTQCDILIALMAWHSLKAFTEDTDREKYKSMSPKYKQSLLNTIIIMIYLPTSSIFCYNCII